jgi:hypothetical protein
MVHIHVSCVEPGDTSPMVTRRVYIWRSSEHLLPSSSKLVLTYIDLPRYLMHSNLADMAALLGITCTFSPALYPLTLIFMTLFHGS